eukprot:6625525-Ditylum_brightwellii.AAC.1
MEFGVSKSLFSAAFLSMGHFSSHPLSTASRVMHFSLTFLFLILTAAYTANLASFLVVQNTPAIVINTIRDAVQYDLSFCVLRSSTSENYMLANYPNARLVRKDSIGDTYLSVADGSCDLVLTTVDTFENNRRSATYNANCNLEWVGRVVSFTTA